MFGLSLSRLTFSGMLGGPARPLAIDFGATALRLLQLSDTTPPTIITAAALPTPDNYVNNPVKRFAFQLEQLPALVKSAKVTTKRAIIAIPSWASLCKHVQVPIPELDHCDSYCSSIIASDLTCDPATLVCRPTLVSGANAGGAGNSGKTEVIAMACPRGIIDRMMEAVRAARLTCVGILPEMVAVVQAFDRITNRAEDAATVSLYVDLGYTGTRVMIAHGRDLVFAKTIDVGGRYVDECLAQSSACTLAEAAVLRAKLSGALKDNATQPTSASPQPAVGPMTSGMPHLDAAVKAAAAAQPASMMAAAATEDRRAGNSPVGMTRTEGGVIDPRLAEPLSVITDEIALCLRYHDALYPGVKVNRAVFVGGEARHVGICHHLARVLRLQASVADPLACFARAPGAGTLAGVSVELNKPQPGWAVCAGLSFGTADF